MHKKCELRYKSLQQDLSIYELDVGFVLVHNTYQVAQFHSLEAAYFYVVREFPPPHEVAQFQQ